MLLTAGLFFHCAYPMAIYIHISFMERASVTAMCWSSLELSIQCLGRRLKLLGRHRRQCSALIYGCGPVQSSRSISKWRWGRRQGAILGLRPNLSSVGKVIAGVKCVGVDLDVMFQLFPRVEECAP
jgi:hypothetical protein